MGNRAVWLCVGAWVLAACGGDETTMDSAQLPAGGGGTGVLPIPGNSVAGATSAGVGGSSGTPTSGSAGRGPSAAGTPASAGMSASAGTGTGAAGVAGVPAAGMPAPVGGASGGAAGTMAPPAEAGVPKIPEPKGECPKFTTGTMMFAGLRMQVQAGTPGETKGALLFAWHATAGTAGAAMSGVPASVRNEITMGGGIVIAAQGNVTGSGRTDIAPPTAAWFIQDLEFADEVVACAVKNHNIDPNRIHATGCSAGGLMSGTFGLMRSQYVASVAPNSGGINYQNSRMLSEKSHGPAAFCMHGGTGDNVIVNFSDTSTWFEAQNKLAANKPFMINCNHMRGHCGAPSTLHELAWQFMKAHPYNVGTSPWAMSPPMGLPEYCKVVQ